MGIKNRRGNLLISTAVFVFLTVMVLSALTQMSTKRSLAQIKAKDAGKLSTCLTVADLCADVFVEDLRSHSTTIAVASGGYFGDVGDPAAVTGREYEIFDEALVSFLGEMRGEAGDGTSWIYKKTDLKDYISYASIPNSDVNSYLNSVLETAKVQIVVNNVFSLSVSLEDDLTMSSGDYVSLTDIAFTVTLDYGLTRIVQSYTLRGEQLTADFDSVYAMVSVSGAGEKVLESQSVNTTLVKKS